MTKYLGIALAIALLALGIATKYAAHEHDALVMYEAQVKQEQKDQQAANDRKEKDNADQAAIVAKTWKDDHDHLVANLNVLRNSAAGGVASDEAAINSCGIAPGYRQLVGTGQSLERFIDNALQAELNLRGIREWVARERIPTK